jgi:hypothetical protein
MAASPRKGKQPRSGGGGGGGGGGATTARKTRKLPPRQAIILVAEELVFGKVIGRGSQGCVRLAKHRATGKRYGRGVRLVTWTLLALSSLGVFDHTPY